MYHWLKIIFGGVVFISSLITIKNTWNAYKEKKEKGYLLEFISKIIIIPSSLILLIAEYIG